MIALVCLWSISLIVDLMHLLVCFPILFDSKFESCMRLAILPIGLVVS